MTDMKCMKCGGEMEEGFILDKAGPSGVHVAKPEWGMLTENRAFGGKILVSRGLKNRKEIVTNRCTSCGFLESYAK